MSCICGSDRRADVSGKVSDMCSLDIVDGDEHHKHEGYVPRDIGIGGGDYIEFVFCLNCGRMEGEFPITPEDVTQALRD
jgi:hypothetical protein